MTPATDFHRSQAGHRGQRRFNQTASPSDTPAHSIRRKFKSQQQSNAAHHAPAQEVEVKSHADAGRVHALVRPPVMSTFNSRDFNIRNIHPDFLFLF
jgi:hypothetical protein